MEQGSQKENSKIKKGKKKNKGKNKSAEAYVTADKTNGVVPATSEAVSKAAPDKNVHRPRKEIVDLFWLVSNEDAKVRQASICKLSSFSSLEETSYILKRLVGGLASDRHLVRPTFGVALTSLLVNNGNVDGGRALLNSALEQVRGLEVCGSPKEKRNAALGRIAVYAAVLRSGLLSKDSPHLLEVLKDVAELSRIDRTISKSVLRLLLALLDAFSSASSFKEVFWPTLLPVFKPLAGEKGCDVEALTLLLRCAIKYPIAVKKRTKADLGFKLDFSSICWSSGAICATFEKASAELMQHEHAEEAKDLFLSFVELSGESVGIFERFWTDFVCGRMCPSKDKNVLLLKVLDVVFRQSPTTEILNAVLFRRGLDALSISHQLPRKNPGRLAAEAVIDKLAKFVVDETIEEDRKMIILRAVVKQETGTDSAGGGRLASAVNRLLSAAPDNLLRKVWILLRDELLQESKKKANQENDKKRFLWLIKQTQSCLQKRNLPKTSEWEVEVLQLLFLLSHFHLPERDAEVPSPSLAKIAKSCPDWLMEDWLSSSVSTPALLTNERQKIGETVFDAVARMALAKEGRVDEILRFSHYVDALLSASPSLLVPQLSSPEVATTWQEVAVVIASVEKQKSLLPEGQESPVLDVFQKLFLVLGFQVFTDLESVKESLPDLKVCAVKGCGLDIAVEGTPNGDGEKEEEEDFKWIDVLTEVLVSFLLKENQNYRKLVVSAIPLLLPHFTEKSFQIIKDSVVGKFAGEDVIAVEEEEEEEEEDDDDNGDEEEGQSEEEAEVEKEEGVMDDDEGDDEVDDDDDDDDDGDDGPIDSTEDELLALKMKLASAMGEARPKHLEMDPETDNEESDVDDEEMFKFDDKIAGVFKELESKKKASAEKKATAKKLKQIEESKMKFRLRCLDVLSALFLHVADVDAFLLLFDTLVDLEAATRCKAGSTLSSKSAFDDRVKHLVKEVAQFRRGGVLKASPSFDLTAALNKLRGLLKENLKHAAPQSKIPNLCNILVKILLASSASSPAVPSKGDEAAPSASDAEIHIDVSADLKSSVNASYLDNLEAVLSSGRAGGDGDAGGSGNKSPVGNVKYEHFSPFEGFVNRFQKEVVDDAMLARLEELVYRGDLSSFCRRKIVGIFNHVLGIFCRRGGDGGEGEKMKEFLARNLKACLDCAISEVGKKETTGFDASSIVSFLSIIQQMHKSKGKIVTAALQDCHRESLRQLAGAVMSSPAGSAPRRMLIDGVRRVAMYWGLTAEIQQLCGGKKKKGGGGGGGDVVVAPAVGASVSSEVMRTEPVAPQTNDNNKRKLVVPSSEEAKARAAGGGGGGGGGDGGGGGKRRKRQKMESSKVGEEAQ